ncbi:PRA1 family protein F3-like [Olea europaea var. sylvestris]|uniref:PRA1 family protein n=1 Tax=Olea europaea subsp. europaea TaxID=158383 RepID=A0A8S0VHH1_OLEEU|nr:PRA1 family protein F3-like [Olea europaea var. sylvestris]CAA3032245.1 PRA1 family F3-like [Olea europaea subsp. europaea]
MSTGYSSLPTDYGSATAEGGVFIRAKSRMQLIYATSRPWRELFSHPASYTIPYSVSEFTSRFKRNFNYFRVNYAMIMLFILFLSLLWHPISMIVFLVVFVFWFLLYFFREEPIELFNRMLDDRVVSIVLGIVTIVCLIFTGVWLNILVSILIGLVILVLHAGFRATEDLFLDEDEVADGGLLSVVGSTYTVV